MRTWKKYPKYKDSGVEWLGEIPDGWVFKRLKFSCQINPSKSELSKSNDELTVTFLPMELLGEDHNLTLTENRNISDVWNGFTYFQNNDVILAKITPCFENGKCAVCHDLTNGIGFGTTELHVLRPIVKNSSEFLFYVIQSHGFKEIGKELMFGTTGQKRLPAEYVSNYSQGFPPLHEQTAIASFLDRETTRIDALIEKKQRQIELLQEKRAALISQAVTKGLDPTVPMKDSGVPWLGEVPEHWVITRLKYCVDKSGSGIQMGPFGSMLTQLDDNFTGYKLYGQENIIKNDFNELGSRYISYELYKSLRKYVLNKGDLVLTRKGSLGQCKKVPELDTPGIGDSDTIRIRPNCEKILTNFLVRTLHESQYIQDQIHIAQRGAIISGLNSTIIENILIILPPMKEQKEILQYFDNEVTKNERTIEKISMSLGYLSEYRSALISAAVTGKIDVRETIPTHSEASS